jgi:hypothetical protein
VIEPYSHTTYFARCDDCQSVFPPRAEDQVHCQIETRNRAVYAGWKCTDRECVCPACVAKREGN